MAYVLPNTTIRLLAYNGTPDYTDTYSWASEAEQQEAMMSVMVGKVYDDNSYTRISRQRIRIADNIKNIKYYSYVAYCNNDYENKWVYAFITEREYIDENCTEIAFEVDVIQTWYWDIKNIGRVFMSRCHQTTDEIGDNLQPEPVQTGEMVYEPAKKLIDTTASYVIISVGALSASHPQSGIYRPRVYDGVATGSTYRIFQSSDISGIRAFLTLSETDNYKNQIIQNVNGLWYVPSFLLNINPPSGGMILEDGTFGGGGVLPLLPADTEKFGSYTPKNKKLYTYPYNYMTISNGGGQNMTLRYEFFQSTDGAYRFKYYGTVNRPAQIVLRPISYSGDGEPLLQHVSMQDALTSSTFPQGQWNTGGYTEWQAQNSIPQIAEVFLGTVGGAVLGGMKNPVGLATNVLGGIASTMMTDYRASFMQPNVRGSLVSGGANAVGGYNNFYYSRYRLHSQFARTIDDFFSAFGYAQNRIMELNLRARPSWTFIQTDGFRSPWIVPSRYRKSISDIMNNGIRFWVWDGAQDSLGNYDRDNSPAGG